MSVRSHARQAALAPSLTKNFVQVSPSSVQGATRPAPHYIKNYCQPTSSLQCRYELCSLTGVSLIIPRTKTKFGERSFAVPGPKSWNFLPYHVKAASSIVTFKSRLKTFLFGLSYSA